jgi:uncharacterized protein YcbK (DUF882 family)
MSKKKKRSGQLSNDELLDRVEAYIEDMRNEGLETLDLSNIERRFPNVKGLKAKLKSIDCDLVDHCVMISTK